MPIRISQPSHQSLYVETWASGKRLSTGTAFVASGANGQNFLVTNRHIVTGRHNGTDKCLSETLAVPDALVVWHNSKGNLGQFVRVESPLFVNDEPQWIEHPAYKAAVDVVAIPLPDRDDLEFVPYRIDYQAHMKIEPTSRVSIVGFPFGERTGASFAIWSTGFVASEPQIPHGGQQVFLVDCRARPGQSGSPVIRYRNGGGLLTHDNGSEEMSPITEFLGVYSGRINELSDLGMVWNAWIISELLAFAISVDRGLMSPSDSSNQRPSDGCVGKKDHSA